MEALEILNNGHKGLNGTKQESNSGVRKTDNVFGETSSPDYYEQIEANNRKIAELAARVQELNKRLDGACS